MKKYLDLNGTIYDTERNCSIPPDLGNMDYQEFLRLVEEGKAEVEKIEVQLPE